MNWNLDHGMRYNELNFVRNIFRTVIKCSIMLELRKFLMLTFLIKERKKWIWHVVLFCLNDKDHSNQFLFIFLYCIIYNKNAFFISMDKK